MQKQKPFLRRFTKKILIICNIVIALLFFAGSYAKFFDPERWWFIGLLTLSLPYILFVLLGFFIFWIIVKKIWLLIFIVIVLACWNPVHNIFPFNFSGNFKTEKDPGDLRIMSWNVEHFNILLHKTHPELKTQMLDLINKYQPDVACFQEMVAGDDDKAINYLGDFKNILHFSGYYYSYDNKYDFDRYHHFGIIIFSKYPIINKQTIGIPPNDYNSEFQHVDLLVNNDTLRIFNIHLQSLKFSQDNLRYLDNPSINTDTALTESRNIVSKLKRGFLRRERQSKKVHEEILQSPYPVVVCGDFNDVPNSFAYETIGEGLQNAFVKKGFGFGRTFSGISPTLRIDNIFVDKRFSIEQFTRIPKKLSDHFPIIADVRLEK